MTRYSTGTSQRWLLTIGWGILASLVVACSDTDGNENESQTNAGTTATGGKANAGVTSSGGSSARGGASAGGGANLGGYPVGPGGAPPGAGGSPSFGGSLPIGGGPVGSGGHIGAGGSGFGGSGNGGSPSNGGALPAVGGTGSGGISVGGVTGSGGSPSAGGELELQGGASPEGGGAPSDGGVIGLGGQAGGSAGSPVTEGGTSGGGSAGAEGGASGEPGAAGATPEGGAGGYNPCPTNGEDCRILPFGDSITHGVGSSDEGAYRVPLFELAVAANQKLTFTGSQQSGPSQASGQDFPRFHEGHDGWTIDPGFSTYGAGGLSELVPSPAFDTIPHIVLLMIGTNDTGFAEPEKMADRLEGLLDKIVAAAPDALVVVAQPVPFRWNSDPLNAYNAAIPGIVEERAAAGQHMVTVDMFQMPVSYLGSDGVHPNDQGYSFMADVWYEAIRDYLPQ